MRIFIVDEDGQAAIEKDPADDLDYSLDWTAWLASANNDTINTSEWTVDSPLAKHDDTKAGAVTTCFISGGEAGQSYRVSNKIVTNSTPPRTKEFGFILMVKEQPTLPA